MFHLIRSLSRLMITILLIVGLLFVYARFIEPFRLQLEEVTVSSPYLSEAADGIKILAFSDTHFGEYYTTEQFVKALAMMNETEPDLVIFLGDLIDHYDQYIETESTEEISALLSQIEAPYGKFAVFGNHDYGGGAETAFEAILGAGGFDVLVNEQIVLDDLNLSIIGIDDIVIGYGDPKVTELASEERYTLALSHAPDVADQIKQNPIDLVLSGHTHGMQVNLNFLEDYILPPYGRHYKRGLYELDSKRDAKLYVTAGIGMTILPLRFLSPPEITLITLERM